MKNEWLQGATLQVASLLVPGDQRTDWLEEWRSELWYVPRNQATPFCMGAFRDAFWLMRNNTAAVKRTRMHLESPLSCLAFLATLSALSIFIVVQLLGPRLQPETPLRARDLAGMCVAVLALSCVFLTSTLTIRQAGTNGHLIPWSRSVRRGLFLILKLALLQPIILCAFFAPIGLGRLGGFASLASDAAVILALRWVITDQQKRCPVCLRLLANPVIIGTASRTFLEWYGTETTCPHGHGLLHTSEIVSSYSGPRWLGLDDSWSGLFAKGAGRHL
jgi:hypothetical protein